MRTNLLPAASTSLLWLEHESPGQETQRIELESLPFTIGRNETCDYPIPSSSVSREHAEFVREDGILIVRDLKSTNGTLVNGKRITEQRLNDGDLVVIADVSFTFRSNRGQAARATATRVITRAAGEGTCDDNAALELIHAIRRQHEALLHRAARNRFHPIYDLVENRCIGYEAVPRPPLPGEHSPAQQTLEASDCRLTERSVQIHRLLAAESVATLTGATLLFVKLQPAEVGGDLVPQSFGRLREIAGGKQIVAEIPDTAVVDIPYFREFCVALRDREIGIAFDSFAGSLAQFKAHAEFKPDFLKLSSAIVRGVDRSTQRQQQMKALAEVALEQDVQLIADGVHSDNEARTCREFGCRLAQGDHFGRAQTIDWPLPTAAV